MEPLLVLAAFSFHLCCQPAQSPIHELNFRPTASCSNVEQVKLNPSKTEEKLKLASTEPQNNSKNSVDQKLAAFTSKYSPTISLNKVSWMNSSLTEQYDPRLSVSIRRLEQSGYEALLKVSIPL